MDTLTLNPGFGTTNPIVYYEVYRGDELYYITQIGINDAPGIINDLEKQGFTVKLATVNL